MAAEAERSARDDLRAMVLDVVAWSVMIGLGESYLSAFALAVGAEQWAAGLLSTVPVLVGSCLQLVSPWAIGRLGSLRRWVVLTVVAQALCFVPLAIGGWAGTMPVLAIFAVTSLYYAFAQASGPAWNTWAEQLVPKRIRARYFARRSRISQVVTGLTLLGSGALLQLCADRGLRLPAFAALFMLAAAARLVSARLLAAQRELPGSAGEEKRVPLRVLSSRARSRSDGRLLVYMLATTFAVHLSAPFFAPFLLEQYRLGYLHWVAILAMPYLSRIVVLPYWAELADKHGADRLVWLGGLGIIPLPVMWTLSDQLPWLLTVALWSGLTWQAYELGTFLLFFEAIRREERTSILTTYNTLRAMALVAGSLVGAAWLRWAGESVTSYGTLFLWASVARVLAMLALRPGSAGEGEGAGEGGPRRPVRRRDEGPESRAA